MGAKILTHSWIQAARPKTLTAAVVPILVGTALVPAGAPIQWKLSAFALLSAIFIQIGTNLVNDAIDFKKGADTDERIGPARVTASGIFTPNQVLAAAFVCLAMALLLGIPLVLSAGWPLVVVGIVSLFFAYGYTGGPFPLAYLGLGDLFVLLFFGFVAVGGVFYLHTGAWGPDAWVAGAQVGLLATVLIAINNLRDHVGDARVGKRTLAVRLGVSGSRAEIACLALLPFAGSLYWALEKRWGAALLPLLALPVAIRLVSRVYRTEPGPEYNGLLAQSAKLHVLFGALWSLGAFLGRFLA